MKNYPPSVPPSIPQSFPPSLPPSVHPSLSPSLPSFFLYFLHSLSPWDRVLGSLGWPESHYIATTLNFWSPVSPFQVWNYSLIQPFYVVLVIESRAWYKGGKNFIKWAAFPVIYHLFSGRFHKDMLKWLENYVAWGERKLSWSWGSTLSMFPLDQWILILQSLLTVFCIFNSVSFINYNHRQGSMMLVSVSIMFSFGNDWIILILLSILGILSFQ